MYVTSCCVDARERGDGERGGNGVRRRAMATACDGKRVCDGDGEGKCSTQGCESGIQASCTGERSCRGGRHRRHRVVGIIDIVIVG